MQVKVNKAVPSWSAPTAAYHITSNLIAKYMTKDIHNIILTQEYPQIWRDIQTIWIEKTDKDPSIIHNRRPINLEEPGFKAYLNTLQEELAESLLEHWKPTTTGSIAHRSTVDSIMSVTTLIQKLIKQKQSFVIIYNDSTKAFDNMDTIKLAKVLRDKLKNNPEIAEQIILRLNTVAYVTEINGQRITQHKQQGAPQGCPLSPQTFNIGMQEIGIETNIKRRDKLGLMDIRIPTSYIQPENAQNQNIIEMHQHIYVDDILEIHVIQNPNEIPTLLHPILETQKEWKLQPNLTKTKISSRFCGKGSRGKTKQLIVKAIQDIPT
jgi:hypothetical protein